MDLVTEELDDHFLRFSICVIKTLRDLRTADLRYLCSKGMNIQLLCVIFYMTLL